MVVKLNLIRKTGPPAYIATAAPDAKLDIRDGETRATRGYTLRCFARAERRSKAGAILPHPSNHRGKNAATWRFEGRAKNVRSGSGDGRIVIMAAQKFHAQAMGIEIDREM